MYTGDERDMKTHWPASLLEIGIALLKTVPFLFQSDHAIPLIQPEQALRMVSQRHYLVVNGLDLATQALSINKIRDRLIKFANAYQSFAGL